MIVGIDLGTTNSLIGVIEKGRPRLFAGEDGSSLVPSVLHFSKSGEVVVGSDAKAKRKEDLKQTLYSTKRFIGRGKNDVKEWAEALPFDFSKSDDHMVRFSIGNKAYTPIETASLILKKLKSLAETQSGQKVEKAVVTVPAYFNDSQRQATKFAGELAGLEIVRILNEPTAACLAYGLDKKTAGTIAVFDLGGGTFDISILRVKEGVFEVLAANGDTLLGGDDFDEALVKAILPGRHVEPAWTLEAERVKRALTDAATATFSAIVDGKPFQKEISREEFEVAVTPVLKRVEGPVKQCLADASLRAEQISDVILVGGSTRSPLVKQFVKNIFKREPICSINPDEVVAMGATVQANVLAGQTGEILLLDVVPLSLGIETIGDIVSKIIHRNTTIPVSASETYSTYVDGQTSVDIHVMQGERELVKDNRSLARFQLKGLPPLPAGIPKIEVEFTIDANGILSVRAVELRTGIATSVTVNPTYGLTDQEVEGMLEKAFENAESDFEARFLSEARTEAESVIRATEKAISKATDLLEADEKQKIDAAVTTLRAAMSATDHKAIKEKLELLNQVTQPFAERLLNHAVSDALKNKNLAEQAGRPQ